MFQVFDLTWNASPEIERENYIFCSLRLYIFRFNTSTIEVVLDRRKLTNHSRIIENNEKNRL